MQECCSSIIIEKLFYFPDGFTLSLSTSLQRMLSRTRWHGRRKSYRTLYWREIMPLAVPIFIENTCVLLMGVLSTFLVSWLGKEAMAGVGLADSFNMVILAFSPPSTWAPQWWWRSASANAIPNAPGRRRGNH